jgi:DNA-binding MarR family transcriptional regulator
VSGVLAKEIKQTKPFDSLEAEAFLNLGRTWEYLQGRVADFLKQYQLTPTQYNMLRILRGAGSNGLSCSEACARMITLESDITRLLDRMEVRGLIARERSKEDRRVVVTTITDEGLTILQEIDDPLRRLLRRDVGHLGPRRLADLIETLEDLRSVPD